MIGIGISPCTTPPAISESGPPAETILRTAVKTFKFETQGDIPVFDVTGISVAAGCWLTLQVGYDAMQYATSITDVYIGAVHFTKLAERQLAVEAIVEVWGAYFASAVTNATMSIATDTSDTTPTLCTGSVTQVAGLNASGQPVACGTAAGNSTAPSAGSVAPTVAHAYVVAVIATEATTADTPVVWGGGFTGGQREGAQSAMNLVVEEGYRIITVEEAQVAGGVLAVARQWGALCAVLAAA